MRKLLLIAAAIFGLTCGRAAFAQQQQALGAYGTVTWTAVKALPTTSGGTLAVYQTVGPTSATLGGAATLNLPSAANLCAGFPSVAAAGTFFNWDWIVYNTSSGASTLTIRVAAGDTSVTAFGTLTVAQNASRHFKVSINGCNTGAPKAVFWSMNPTF